MFSSSVAGAGSICLGCQLRAVTRRAAPVLAASAAVATARTPPPSTAIQSRRRYASDSSDPASNSSSNDDFLTSVINAQRYDDSYEVSKPKKKKGPAPRGKVKGKKQRDTFSDPFTDAFAESFKDQTYRKPSRREASPFQVEEEVDFEDVWDQDPDLQKGETGPRKNAFKRSDIKSDPASEEQQSDEIDYGTSTAEANLYLKNYSWSPGSATELPKYADGRVRRPKNTEPQTQEPQATIFPDTPKKATTKSQGQRAAGKKAEKKAEKKTERKAEKKVEEKAVLGEIMPWKSRVKHTDNLYDWGDESTAAVQDHEGEIKLDGDEGTTTAFQDHEGEIGLEAVEESTAAPQEPQELQDESGLDMVQWLPKKPQRSYRNVFQGPVLKKYRKGEMKLVENLTQLPVETLGKDAPVIVLREQGPWKRSQLGQDQSIDSSLNIEDYVDQEADLSMDMIMENIDELRPEHRILPAREFKDKFDTLMKGFTVTHLDAYIDRNRQRLAEGDETPFLGVIPDELVSRPWVVSQSRWIPEVEGAVEDVPHPLKGYILKTMPPKQRLVMQLMRECWGMSVQELLHGQGVLDFEIRDLEFRLLTLGHQRFLQHISRSHLGQGGGKSIRVVKSRKALQIIAPKAVAEACVKAMDEVLDNIRSKSIKMDKLPVKNLSDSMLEELSRITNSLVEVNDARQEIEVTWIDVAQRYNSKFEDSSDVVLRMILAAHPSFRTSKALTVYPDPAEQARLIEDIDSKDKLAWNDRRMAWARLCLPVTTKANAPQLAKHWPLGESMLKYKIEPVPEDLIEPTSTIEPKKRAFYSSRAGEPLTLPRTPLQPEETHLKKVIEPTKPTPSGWLPFHVRTNAIFGHVLHLNNQHVAASIKQATDEASASRRAMRPFVPPLTELDIPAWVPYKTPKYMTSLIIMRFTPTSATPAPSSNDNSPAPSLELRIKATSEELIGIDCLRAIAHTHVSDICLPGDHVDVRATQRLVAELPGAKVDTTEGMQPLTQFLNDAVLEVSEGSLVTPPVLDGLGLPSWMFYAPETDAKSPFLRSQALAELQDATTAAAAAAAASAPPAETSKPKKAKAPRKSKKSPPTHAAHTPYDPSANTLTPTSYIFSGIEVHQPIETNYDGWKLSYTSIEAGAGGGRRAELALEAVPSGDKDVRRGKARIDVLPWLRSVYKLATGRKVVEGWMTPGDEGAAAVEEEVEESEKVTSLVKWVTDKK